MKSITMSFFTVALVFLELLVVATINLSFCNGSSHVGCVQSERKALLSFKQDLNYDPSNRLGSWVGDGDCCRWAGVVCDNFTGHVLELHLRNPHLEYLILSVEDYTSYVTIRAESEAYERSMLGGKINPSLLDLKHLIYLDLSGNHFDGHDIPEFLGSIENLRYLNLSNAGFSGIIPQQLGNLSKLQYLDLNYKFQPSIQITPLHVENLFWLSGLSLLEHLDLSGVNLSKASDHWLPMTNTLSSLKMLQLSKCRLDHFLPMPMVNFSSLTTLDLSHNRFSNDLIPSWIFDLSDLVFLNLGGNQFQGSIPGGLQNLTSLKHLDLSLNSFNSSIPKWLYRFSHLEYLSLRQNNLQGRISSGLGNLTSLVRIDLSLNDQLVGSIPRSFGRLCNLKSISLSVIKLSQEMSEILDIFSMCISNNLESLYIGGSQISGQFTDRLGKFKNLHTFDASENSISGPMPSSLGELSSLEILIISFNKLNGTLSEMHFANVTRLLYFDASENPLAMTVSLDWIPFFQLEHLNLRSCYLGPRFPSWLLSQKFLLSIDISNSGISDNILSPFWNFLSQTNILNLSCNNMYGQIPNLTNASTLFVLDLSSNNFSGPLPLLHSSVSTVNFSNNTFSGSISQFLCYKTKESKQTQVLKLGLNLLAEEIPDCWMNWPSLEVLDLGINKFTGSLPTSIGTLMMLESLHLRKNNFFGPIPVALKNCTELRALDVSENELVGPIPTWIGETFASSMIILNLRSNKFHGSLPLELCNLASLQILDLADNNLFGAIPRCIKNISAMVTMEFPASNDMEYDNIDFSIVEYHVDFVTDYIIEDTSVVTKGVTNEYSTILNLVRSMDLSKNNFSGEIPIEVMNLTALQSLNLSHNSFTGKIPANFGAMKSLESVDFSSNQLSGEIPQSISSLTFLSHLNLSNNNLIGKIPLSTQLQGFDPSCFMGNELCGSPLPKNCTSPTSDHNNGRSRNNGEGHEVDWFYVSMALGFVVGFWSLIGPLIVNRRWRYMYCRFLDQLGDIIGSIVRKCF